VNIIPTADRAEAVKLAEELYDKECDFLKCPTQKEQRVTRSHCEPLQHADTKAFAALVTDRALGVVSLLSAGAGSKLETSADVDKWKPESELLAAATREKEEREGTKI